MHHWVKRQRLLEILDGLFRVFHVAPRHRGRSVHACVVRKSRADRPRELPDLPGVHSRGEFAPVESI